MVQRGSYVCRIDARKLVRGEGLGRGPLFKSVVAQVGSGSVSCMLHVQEEGAGGWGYCRAWSHQQQSALLHCMDMHVV